MMRESRVQPHPAPVAAAVETCDLVPDLARGLARDAQVALAAKLDRSVAHLDADLLLPPRTKPPQLGGRKRRCRDGGLRGSADGERGGQRRFGAGERHGIECSSGLARGVPEGRQCGFRRGSACHSPEIILYRSCLRKSTACREPAPNPLPPRSRAQPLPRLPCARQSVSRSRTRSSPQSWASPRQPYRGSEEAAITSAPATSHSSFRFCSSDSIDRSMPSPGATMRWPGHGCAAKTWRSAERR